MNRKILFVDDEENVLRGFERTLRSQFEMDTAVGTQQGLAAVASRGPYSVVVSDLRMPGMDGVQFLSEVRKSSPDTVRLILSGNGDFDSVVAAVNEGSIFQFLTKPIPADQLRNTLNTALKQHQLIIAERELLEETLNGSLRVMTEVLSIVNPMAFGRASRIRAYTRQMAQHLQLTNTWEFDLAAMLSQIGCIAVPPEILEKMEARMPLSKEEKESFISHPIVGHDLIYKIPRLGEVAEIVRHQMTPLRDLRALKISETIAVGAQMLLIANLFDEKVSRGSAPASALNYMRERAETYQASVVSALEQAEVGTVEMAVKEVFLSQLKPGMIVHEDIRAMNGLFLVGKGHDISQALVARLGNFARTAGVVEPFLVLVPVAAAAGSAPERSLREQLVPT